MGAAARMIYGKPGIRNLTQASHLGGRYPHIWAISHSLSRLFGRVMDWEESSQDSWDAGALINNLTCFASVLVPEIYVLCKIYAGIMFCFVFCVICKAIFDSA